jgi:hypothetical protein
MRQVDQQANVSSVHAVGPNITFTGLDLSQCSMGGHKASDASVEPPHSAINYPPRYMGTRPGYGLFVRNAFGVSVSGLKLGWDEVKGKTDDRPAVVVENATVGFDSLSAKRDDGGSSYDVGLRAGAKATTITNSPGIIVKQI